MLPLSLISRRWRRFQNDIGESSHVPITPKTVQLTVLSLRVERDIYSLRIATHPHPRPKGNGGATTYQVENFRCLLWQKCRSLQDNGTETTGLADVFSCEGSRTSASIDAGRDFFCALAASVWESANKWTIH